MAAGCCWVWKTGGGWENEGAFGASGTVPSEGSGCCAVAPANVASVDWPCAADGWETAGGWRAAWVGMRGGKIWVFGAGAAGFCSGAAACCGCGWAGCAPAVWGCAGFLPNNDEKRDFFWLGSWIWFAGGIATCGAGCGVGMTGCAVAGACCTGAGADCAASGDAEDDC